MENENKITYLIEKFGSNQIVTHDILKIPSPHSGIDVYSAGFISYDEHILDILIKSFEKRLLRGNVYLFTDYDKIFINMYLNFFNSCKESYLKELSSQEKTAEEILVSYMYAFLLKFRGLQMINKSTINLSINESYVEDRNGNKLSICKDEINGYEMCVKAIQWLIECADTYFKK